MLIFVQYLYGLTWAFSVAYARARLEACARTKREAVTHYVSRLNPRWPIPRVHLRTFSFSPEKPRGKRKYYSVDRDTCNIVTRLCRCSTDRNFSTCRYHVCEIVPCQRREGRKKREKSQVECVVRWTKATQRKLVDIYLGLEIIVSSNRIYRWKLALKGGSIIPHCRRSVLSFRRFSIVARARRVGAIFGDLNRSRLFDALSPPWLIVYLAN